MSKGFKTTKKVWLP